MPSSDLVVVLWVLMVCVLPPGPCTEPVPDDCTPVPGFAWIFFDELDDTVFPAGVVVVVSEVCVTPLSFS